jgi:hypothetical protein
MQFWISDMNRLLNRLLTVVLVIPLAVLELACRHSVDTEQ